MSSSKEQVLRKLEKVKNEWLEKLTRLEHALVIEDSAGNKFSLRKQIQECEQEIEKLEEIINQTKRVDRFPLAVEKSEPMTGLEKSIVLITSQNPETERFGTGFVIMKDEMATYILTSAKVVREVGGIDQVMVNIYPATVIVQSPENYADDLAVLQVKVLLDAPILPLGKCGKPGSIFATFGCQRNSFYEIKQINGYLSEFVRRTNRYQAWWTYVWKLKIEDDSSLTPGFYGSPVIDSRNRTVTGIFRDREKEQLYLAISVTNLKNVWSEMPSTLLRKENDLHDLRVIGDWLESHFDDQRQFSGFCLEYFPSGFDAEIPYDWQIEYLISYCHQNSELNYLLRRVEQLNPKRGLGFWKRLSYFSVFRRKLTNRIEEPASLAEITLAIESFQLIPERLEAAIYAIARKLKILWSYIKVREVLKPASVVVKVEIPSKALDRLIDLYQRDLVTRRNLGILYVTETFDEWFYLANLQALLEQGFTGEELAAICHENFRHFSEQLPPETGKAEIIDGLIEYVRQESRIPELLDLASQRNREAYNKFGPYYKVPRRPSRDGRPQPAPSGLTRREIAIAGILGAGTATFGVLMLFIAAIILALLDRSGILASLIWFGLIPLGDIVGRVVSMILKHRHGEVVGRLAAISYLIGCTVWPIILFLVLLIQQPEALIDKVVLFFSFVYTYVQLLLRVLSDVRSWIGLTGGLAWGAYSAYRRAR